MSAREEIEIEVAGGTLRGWITGAGEEVLLLHGGPGMSYAYLDALVEELGGGYRIAAYQQRGLAPSTLEGPFSIPQEIEDAVAVLDGLGFTDPLIVGHSWGGHLALRLAAAIPERLRAVLAIDPLGVAGDGGEAAFEAEMIARTPRADRDRAHELDQRAMAGEGTREEAMESLRLVWPAYYADPLTAPPMPPSAISIEAYSGIFAQVRDGLDEIAAELAEGRIAYGVVAGAASPMPWGQAALASVELSPRAFLQLVPAAGHFVWYEQPGSVRAALKRLTG